MIFPNSPATLSPAARQMLSCQVMTFRRSIARQRHTLQEVLDDSFALACTVEALAAGRRAARALKVGDVFLGCNHASIEHFGSDPWFSRLPTRARLEHEAFRTGFLAALPHVWMDENARIVLMRRAAPRTRRNDKGGFVVLEQRSAGLWKPVGAKGADVYPTMRAAADVARHRPAADLRFAAAS